jgi:hypothetical protein
MSKAKRVLRRKLAAEERVIARRLADAVAPNLSGPVLGRARIGYELSERSAGTAHGESASALIRTHSDGSGSANSVVSRSRTHVEMASMRAPRSWRCGQGAQP